MVSLSTSRIILSIMSQLEKIYKSGEDEAGESVPAKINHPEVVERTSK